MSKQSTTRFRRKGAITIAIYLPDYELSFNNREDVLRLPVPPQDTPEPMVPGNNKEWATTDVGSFMSIGHEGLMSLTIKSFFPAQDYPFCVYHDFPTPNECKALLEKWQHSKRPIRLIITGFMNEAFAIDEMSFKPEIATGDLYFSLTLRKYPFAQKREIPDKDKKSMVLINLIKGQTLCELADKYLGDSDRYKDIIEWNHLEDWGYLWKATEKNNHQLWFEIRPNEPGWKLLGLDDKGAHGNG